MEQIPRALLRKVENLKLPLLSLAAISELRSHLDRFEVEAMQRAVELGASADDIAEALGMTPQGVRYRLRALAD
jgi:DNA-binding Lrp family transcriptional regulator